MTTKATHKTHDNTLEGVLLMAFELRKNTFHRMMGWSG